MASGLEGPCRMQLLGSLVATLFVALKEAVVGYRHSQERMKRMKLLGVSQ